MTFKYEIINDPNYIQVLDHGFVGLVDYCGSDEKICTSSRVSYGQGTKSVSENSNLIRYLMRHKHTSPFEMVDVTFHIKCPIFVMRQLIRHRTAKVNEYSGRYSVMSDEFYVPELENIQPQSQNNNQGRSGEILDVDKKCVQENLKKHSKGSYLLYENLL